MRVTGNLIWVQHKSSYVLLAPENSLHIGQLYIPVVDSGRAWKSKIKAGKQGLVSGEGLFGILPHFPQMINKNTVLLLFLFLISILVM